MTTLKEIAALFRLYVDEIAKVRVDQIEQHPYLPEAEEAADQLEALALAGAEPVAGVVLMKDGPSFVQRGDEAHWVNNRGAQRLYAAPQRMAVSRKSLRDALRNNFSPDVTPEDIAEMALRALGIELRDEG